MTEAARVLDGQVVDVGGEALAGAVAMLHRSRAATLTDADGRFALPLPDSDEVLVVNLSGHGDARVHLPAASPPADLVVTLLAFEPAAARTDVVEDTGHWDVAARVGMGVAPLYEPLRFPFEVAPGAVAGRVEARWIGSFSDLRVDVVHEATGQRYGGGVHSSPATLVLPGQMLRDHPGAYHVQVDLLQGAEQNVDVFARVEVDHGPWQAKAVDGMPPQALDQVGDARTDAATPGLDIVAVRFTNETDDAFEAVLELAALPDDEGAAANASAWSVHWTHGGVRYFAARLASVATDHAAVALEHVVGTCTMSNLDCHLERLIPGRYEPGAPGRVVFLVPKEAVGAPQDGTSLERPYGITFLTAPRRLPFLVAEMESAQVDSTAPGAAYVLGASQYVVPDEVLAALHPPPMGHEGDADGGGSVPSGEGLSPSASDGGGAARGDGAAGGGEGGEGAALPPRAGPAGTWIGGEGGNAWLLPLGLAVVAAGAAVTVRERRRRQAWARVRSRRLAQVRAGQARVQAEAGVGPGASSQALAAHAAAAAAVAGSPYARPAPVVAAATPPRAGEVFLAKYLVERELGRGAFGQVWLATHRALARRVVIKQLHPEWAAVAETRARFEREARILASLDHPHVTRILDVELVGAAWFLVMEYVDGGSVEDALARGPMPVAQAAALMGQVLEGLAYLHARGVLHRDLKPANILCGADGGAKIADFGVARTQDPGHTLLTLAASPRPGTPLYMAPEQVRGAVGDARSDLYAAAAVCYRMMAGRPYIDLPAGDPLALQRAIVEEPPRLPVAGLPEGLNAWLAKGLAKDPAQRFQDAGEMLQALRDAVGRT